MFMLANRVCFCENVFDSSNGYMHQCALFILIKFNLVTNGATSTKERKHTHIYVHMNLEKRHNIVF